MHYILFYAARIVLDVFCTHVLFMYFLKNFCMFFFPSLIAAATAPTGISPFTIQTSFHSHTTKTAI